MDDKKATQLLELLAQYFSAYPDTPSTDLSVADLAGDLWESICDPMYDARARAAWDTVGAA